MMQLAASPGASFLTTARSGSAEARHDLGAAAAHARGVLWACDAVDLVVADDLVDLLLADLRVDAVTFELRACACLG